MRYAFFSALLAAFFCAPQANAEIVERFTVEDWNARAYTSDTTGEFSHCAVYASYQNGSTLYISSFASGGWYLSVENDAWPVGDGGQFAIRFKIDRHAAFNGTADGIGDHLIGLAIDDGHPFIAQLRHGNLLTVTFQNRDYGFELSNSNKAMTAAQDCVRRHLLAGTHTTPSSESGSASASNESTTPESDNTLGQPMPSPNTPAEDSGQQQQQPSTPTATGPQLTFGPWVVTAAADAAGTFANCTAYGIFGDDQLILAYLPDDSWGFGLYREQWNLDTNATYYLWYNVDAPADGAGVIKRPVQVLEPKHIYFDVSESEDIIDRMEHGSTLNVELHSLTGAVESYSYALDQASEAFAAARTCVSNQGIETGASNAPSKEGGTKGAQEEADASAQEQSASEEPSPPTSDTSGSGEQATNEQPAPAPTSGGRRGLPTLGGQIVEDLTVPGWTASAFSDDSGTFTHCAIKAEYQNGATLAVARAADGDLLLGVEDKDWTLQVGVWVPLSYTLTGAASVLVEGQAVIPDLVVANLGNDDALTTAIHDAQTVDIETEGQSLSFNISDIGPGIEAIDDCVSRHNAGATEEAPAPDQAPAAKKVEAAPTVEQPQSGTDTAAADSSGDTAAPEPAPAAPSSDEQQQASTDSSSGNDTIDVQALEAGFATMGTLMKAGYLTYDEVKDPSEIPELLPTSKTAWKVGDVVGVTLVVEDMLPEAIMGAVAEEDLQRCGGSLATETAATDDAGHLHFTVKCGSGASETTIHFVVVPRSAGGSYVFAMLDPNDPTKAAEVAGKLYETSLQS